MSVSTWLPGRGSGHCTQEDAAPQQRVVAWLWGAGGGGTVSMGWQLAARAWAQQCSPLPKFQFILLWEGLVCMLQLPTGSNKDI